MIAYLESKGYLEALSEPRPVKAPSDASDDDKKDALELISEWDVSDRKSKSILINHVDYKIARLVLTCKTAYEI